MTKKRAWPKRLFAMLMAFIMLFGSIGNLSVSAETPTKVRYVSNGRGGVYKFKTPGYDIYRSINTGARTLMGNGMVFWKLGGKPAYCIQLGLMNGDLTAFEESVYSDAWTEDLNGNEREMINRILMYGYRIHDGVDYFLGKPLSETGFTVDAAYAGTQMLVWEITEHCRIDYQTYTPNWFNPYTPLAVPTFFYDSIVGYPAEDAYLSVLDACNNHKVVPDFAENAISRVRSSYQLEEKDGKWVFEKTDSNRVVKEYNSITLDIGNYGTVKFGKGANGILQILENTTSIVSEISLIDNTLKIVFSDNPVDLDVLVTLQMPQPEGFEESSIIFWVDINSANNQDRVTGCYADPRLAFFKIRFKETSMEIPEPEFPEFELDGEKLDLEGGFDGNRHTPRGDGSLAAGFDIDIETDLGYTASEYMQADHNGYGASTSFRIWEGTDDVTATELTTPDGLPYDVTYKGTATITVTEVVPEGYLSEQESGTGNGVETITVDYYAHASRSYEEDDITGEYYITSEWSEFNYKIAGKTGGPAELIEIPIDLGTVTYTNKVKKGIFRLVKGYQKDLDPWGDILGEKVPMEDSLWTLRLVDDGSESHPYVRYVQVKQGETGWDQFDNVYRVVNDTSGVPADSSNPFVTSEHGSFRVLDLPYGTYELQEIQAGTEGYVLLTTYITISEDGQVLSRDMIDYVIENELEVVKQDSETGNTVPYAGVGFRIRYMGNPNTAPEDRPNDPNYGRYLVNGSHINDGYQYVFYTGSNGKIIIPYAIPYGLYQLEEIVAPPGYYIGSYGPDGKGQSVSGDKGYDDTVAIYDANGNKVDYTNNGQIIYNYYPFEVLEQEEGETVRISIPMTNNSVKGKIEVSKLAEELVGFKEVETEHGTIMQPVYEMQPKVGAVFQILAGEDVTLLDGVDPPLLVNTDGNIIPLTLTEHNHVQFPGAIRLEAVTLEDGTEVYYVTEADKRDDNMSYATLLTSLRKGTRYELVYELVEDGFTYLYTISIGLEYAAGGYNYSDISITKTTTADYYTGIFPDSPMPELYNGNDAAALATVQYTNGNQSILTAPVVNQMVDVPETDADYVTPQAFPALVPVLKYDYIPDTTALQVTPPAGFTDAGLPGYHLYTNGTEYRIVINKAGTQEFITCSEAGLEYSNAPGLPDGYEMEVTDKEFHAVSGNDILVAVMDVNEDFYSWLPITNINEVGLYDTTPEIPDGYTLDDLQIEFMYLIKKDDAEEYMVYIHDYETDENCWVPATRSGQFWKSRQQELHIYLTQHNKSDDGWRLLFDGFEFTNSATDEDTATAQFINPFEADAKIQNAVGADITVEGDTTTVLVPHPEASAYFTLADGVQVTAVYLGGYTKTTIIVPEGAVIPTITYDGKEIDYSDEANTGLNPNNPEIETTFDDGNYIRVRLIQAGQGTPEQRVIEIVSNAMVSADAFEVLYNDSHASETLVIPDAQTGIARGQLIVSAKSKTMKYPLGTVIETLVTDTTGMAVSDLLPLGDYLVREVQAPNGGYVATNKTYEVSLEYEGQYVPLVWTSAEGENEAVSIQLDLTKEFENEDGDYEPGEGAVFGVFVYSDIMAAASPEDDTLIDSDTAYTDDMIHTVTSGKDGKALETIKLPFGDYYVTEIDTLDGYILSDDKFIFRVDESTYAGSMEFDYELDGISGKITHTGLNTAEIEIHTLTQVPSLNIEINGKTYDTAKVIEDIHEDIFIKNEVNADRSIMTITVTSAAPAKVKLDNGSIIDLKVGGATYTAVLSGNQDDLELDTGNAHTVSENQSTGTITVEYDPIILYTGYTYDVSAPYLTPDTFLQLRNEVSVYLDYATGSGNKAVILEYPTTVVMPIYYDLINGQIPDGTPEGAIERPAYITVNEKQRKIIVDILALTEPAQFAFSTGEQVIIEKPSATSVVISTDGPRAAEVYDLEGVRKTTGYLPDGLLVEIDGTQVSLHQEDRTISLQSVNKRATLNANVAHDHSFAVIRMDGTIVKAYHGNEPVTLDGNTRTINPGDTLTLMTNDGTVFTASLTLEDRELLLHMEAIIYGSLPVDDNAPLAMLQGSPDNLLDAKGITIDQSIVPLKENTIDAIWLALLQSLTYARNNSFTNQLAVKINARSDNGLTDPILNDREPEEPEEPGKPGKPRPPRKPKPEKPGTTTISKEDVTTAEGLPGALIIITYKEDGREYTRGYTDDDGYFSFETPPVGTYQFYEREAPDGYVINETIFEFTIHDDGSITGDDTIKDAPDTYIITKLDAAFETPLADAVFEFYDEAGTLIHTGISDENGEIRFTVPGAGHYTFREVGVPAGYILDQTTHEIAVNRDGTFYGTFTVYNEPELKIPQTGAYDSIPLLSALAAICLMGIAGTTLYMRKKKDK